MRPYQHKYGNLLAAVGKVDVDVAEVRFQPLAWITRQRDKRLHVLPSRFANVAAHRIVAALVTMLITQPFEDALARVPLLGRRLLIVGKDLLDDGMKATEHARSELALPRKRLGLWIDQGFADFASRMVKRACDGPNTHAIAVGLANACIFVHREHPWLLSS